MRNFIADKKYWRNIPADAFIFAEISKYLRFFFGPAPKMCSKIGNNLMWAQNRNKKVIIYTLRSELLIYLQEEKKNLMKNPLNIIELGRKSIAINIVAIFSSNPGICISIFRKNKT